VRRTAIPPTSLDLLRGEERPYFLWWLDATVRDLRNGLADPDPARRAYWMGAVLREANSRDAWLFVTPAQIRTSWPRVRNTFDRRRIALSSFSAAANGSYRVLSAAEQPFRERSLSRGLRREMAGTLTDLSQDSHASIQPRPPVHWRGATPSAPIRPATRNR